MGFVVVAKSCLTVLGPMDCGLPGSSVHGISQARILENESEVTQSCPTLCDPVDYSPPGSSVHGISQARILLWVAMLSFRGSSQPRDQIQIYHWHCMWMLYYLSHHIKVLVCIFLLPMILRSTTDANRNFVFILDELKIQAFCFFFSLYCIF